MASAYLHRTNGTSTNVYKGTVSHWIKRSGLGAMGTVAAWNNGGTSTERAYLNMHNDTIYFYDQANSVVVQTNRVFRDTSAWYHIVVAWDTSQSTASDRVKIYVNGVQETSMATSDYPSVNSILQFNASGRRFGVGCYAGSGAASGFFDGQMAHFNFIDGLQLTPTSFGETDTTTGIWKPKTAPSVTYGTNGFFLKFDNSGNMGLDSAGSNNLTTSGTIIQQKDTPSNVYATLNPLALGPNSVLSNVSNTCAMNAAAQFGAYSTLGVNSGKWYMEMKYSARTHSYDRVMLGIAGNPNELRRTPAYVGQATDPTSYGYYVDGNRYQNDNATTYGSSYTVGDIIGIALDLENNRLFFSKNGTWQDSGDPTSSTGAISITAPSSTVEGSYFFAVSDTTGSYGGTIQCNFGNGYFGTTAITSAGSNGNGSLFEYDVPTGYYALNTKNIASNS